MTHPVSASISLQPPSGARYAYRLDTAGAPTLEFETGADVFVPTQTSQLLISGARRAINAPGKLLDLGCGVGVCGLVLAKLGACHEPVYASDVSEGAARLARRNAQALQVNAEVRRGNLFEPWAGEQFDVIVDDVSGVCEDIARISRWFPEGVACPSGRDGTALVVRVLQEAPKHLDPDGLLIFPVLSLSCEDRIVEAARTAFAEVSVVAHQSWFLPEELQERFEVLQPLLEAGLISLEQKYGTWLWSTKIYLARSPRPAQRITS